MANDKDKSLPATDLRRRAEKSLKKQAPPAAVPGADHETLRLLHELQVHEIELEMQNNQLLTIQEELELSRNTYVELFDFAPLGYFVFDSQGLIQDLNLAGAQLLGAERQALHKKAFGRYIAETAERETFQQHIALVLQRQTPLRCELKLTRTNGTFAHVQLQSVPKAKVGDITGYVSTAIIDATERKRAEAALRASEQLYRTIGETINYGIWVCGLDGKISYASDSLLKLVGAPLEEYADYRWKDLLHPDDAARVSATWRECIRTGKVMDLEYRLRGLDNEWHPILTRGLPVRNDRGEVLYWAGINLDISRQKESEAALQQAHDNLETTVQDRTKALATRNEQLAREIDERLKTEESLQSANTEIRRLKDRLEAENIYLQQEVAQQHNFGEIVGQSVSLTRIFAQVEQVAPMNATVLLLGETGTGKGLIARAIHGSSTRKDRPLITINCTTLPASLVESELFGRERGAFTGSDARQIGRFELANGSTIFLDEIGELPLELQCKLLRVIQDGEFERLGSPRTIKTDVRIIAATNRNLEAEIKSGTFREDLYYRLNVFPITMPPLRQRKEDIPQLVNFFLAKFNKKIGKRIETVPKETLDLLQAYHWPGNVRELENVIERALIISSGTTLQILDRFDTPQKAEKQGHELQSLVELEHDHILQVLQKTGWRIEGTNGAAVLLGLNASTLRARMRKYGISRQ